MSVSMLCLNLVSYHIHIIEGAKYLLGFDLSSRL